MHDDARERRNRRGRGEGSIAQHPDGRWWARVYLGWKDGKRLRKAVYGKTRREVADALIPLLEAAKTGAALPNRRTTVAAFLDRWLLHKQTILRPRAWDTYDRAVRAHIVPALGHLPIAHVSASHVVTWMADLKAAGTSARSIRYARVVLRAALNDGIRWNVVTTNVAALVTPPRHVSKDIQPLNPAQARALLDAARDHPIESLLSIGTALGLRIGEALGLRWQDVDFARGTISVRQAIERSGGDSVARRRLLVARKAIRARIAAAPKRSTERRALWHELEQLRQEWRTVRTRVHFTEPKSAKSKRTIMMPGLVAQSLKAHRARQRKQRLAAGPLWQKTDLVFTSPTGAALDEGVARRAFRLLLREAGCPPIRFHDLRHTAATLLLAQGVDPRTIMETLGHSQISLTMNTYSHVLPTLQEDAATKMNAILGGTRRV